MSTQTRLPDLVVLSHLRWTWVWQRPQHLVSRLAERRAAGGARTWFVEEPVVADVTAPELHREDVGHVTRLWLVIPPHESHSELPSFDAVGAERLGELAAELFARERRPPHPDLWFYTPIAVDISGPLAGGLVVYDVMDDLASFIKAPQGMAEKARWLLQQADIVFTGGPSLHRSAAALRSDGVHMFRSGVDSTHYGGSRDLRAPHGRPVAGYVGVVDERLDLGLIRDLAHRLPDWTVRLVGPVYKIDPDIVPTAENLEYTGQLPYEKLPEVMADFDVALLPFAINPSTRSISPTKTLEYLAAGLPVVSTRVPDVVADYSEVVHFADDGASFADACRQVVEDSQAARDRLARPLQARQEWDSIAAEMDRLIEQCRAARAASRR